MRDSFRVRPLGPSVVLFMLVVFTSFTNLVPRVSFTERGECSGNVTGLKSDCYFFAKMCY